MNRPGYRVTVLEAAAHDVQSQFDYLCQHSLAGAESWYEAYLTALDRLKHGPLEPGLAPENEHVEDEIRQVIFKTRRGRPYRVLYTVMHDKVHVLRVRGMGQDLLGPDEIA